MVSPVFRFGQAPYDDVTQPNDVIVMFGKKGFGQAPWAARQAIQRQATLVQGETS